MKFPKADKKHKFAMRFLPKGKFNLHAVIPNVAKESKKIWK